MTNKQTERYSEMTVKKLAAELECLDWKLVRNSRLRTTNIRAHNCTKEIELNAQIYDGKACPSKIRSNCRMALRFAEEGFFDDPLPGHYARDAYIENLQHRANKEAFAGLPASQRQLLADCSEILADELCDVCGVPHGSTIGESICKGKHFVELSRVTLDYRR